MRSAQWRRIVLVASLALSVVACGTHCRGGEDAPADTKVAAEADKRLPQPPAAALSESEKQIKDVLKEEYARRGNPERVALAQRLLKLAEESRNDGLAYYVALREAKDIAAAAGDLATAFAAIEGLGAAFKVNEDDLKLTAFNAAARTVSAPEEADKALAAGLGLLGEFAGDGNFDAALRLPSQLEDLARKAKNVEALKTIQTRTSEIRGQQTEWNKVKPMMDKLAANPDDAEAALVVGRYHLLTKGNWDTALPLFAKCSSEALKAAAAKELEAPKEAAAKADIGDLWWGVSEKETGAMKAALQNRSLMWYADAVNELTGMRKIQVEKRMQAAATGTGSGKVAALSYKEGLIRSIPTDQVIRSLTFLPNGRLCLAACDRAMQVIDLESGQKLRSIAAASPALRVAVSMDGRRLAAFGEWGGAKCQEAAVWDLTSGAELGRYKGGELQIHGVGFYADGRAVCLSCVQDTLTVTLREIQGGKVLVPKVAWGGIAQFSVDGSVFLKGNIYDGKTGRVLHKIDIAPEHWAPSEAYCMSRDKRFVAVNEVMKKTMAPAQVSVYEASSGKLVQAIKLLDAKQQLAQARSLDLAPDGKRLLVTVGSQARVHDVASGKELVRWDLKGVTWQSMGCDISPDGHFAVVKGTGGKTICLFGMPR